MCLETAQLHFSHVRINTMRFSRAAGTQHVPFAHQKAVDFIQTFERGSAILKKSNSLLNDRQHCWIGMARCNCLVHLEHRVCGRVREKGDKSSFMLWARYYEQYNGNQTNQPYLGSLLPHAGFRRALVRCIASPEQTKATTNTVVKPLKKTVLLPIMILLTVVPVLACVLDQSESATQMLHLSPTYQYENRATCFHV